MKTIITEQGEAPIPADLRRDMHLMPGQTLFWQQVSSTECRITVQNVKPIPDPVGALEFAEKHGLETMPTDEWLKAMRDGES